MTPALPDRARVVVIGGGVIGTSVAYHLAQHGLERRGAARARPTHLGHHLARRRTDGDLRVDLRDLDRDAQVHARSLRRLEAETGPATGFKPVGFIEVATEPDRLEEYRRVAAFNRYCGVDVHEISPAEVKELFPLARTDDILAGFYVKEDGRANPVDVTMALAQGRAHAGRRASSKASPVTGVLTQGRRGHRRPDRRTATSRPSTSSTAPACGPASSARSGVNIPLQAAEHYYLITEKIPGISRACPCSKIPPPTATSAKRSAG